MKYISLIIAVNFIAFANCQKYPIVINTWDFTSATAKGEQTALVHFLSHFHYQLFAPWNLREKNKLEFRSFWEQNLGGSFSKIIFKIKLFLAWEVIQAPDKTAIDAVVEGCSVCEREQCNKTVGYGGGPNEKSDVALDALLIDG